MTQSEVKTYIYIYIHFTEIATPHFLVIKNITAFALSTTRPDLHNYYIRGNKGHIRIQN